MTKQEKLEKARLAGEIFGILVVGIVGLLLKSTALYFVWNWIVPTYTITFLMSMAIVFVIGLILPNRSQEGK